MYAKAIATLTATVLFTLATASEAEAGFGRRGSQNDSSSNRDREVVRTDRGSRTSDPPSFSSGSSSFDSGRYRSSWRPGYYSAWGYGIDYTPPLAPPMMLVAPSDSAPYEMYEEPPPPPPAGSATLSGDAMIGSGGQLLGVQLQLEGERAGFNAGYSAVFVPIAGTSQNDVLHLGQAHFTYALVSLPHARLRAELGVHIAAAPEVTFVAPGVGASLAVMLAGPVGLEARVFGNAWPYTQLDARAGLALSFNRVGLSMGVRSLFLDDNGVLGVVNAGDTSDFLWGPYVLLAFAL